MRPFVHPTIEDISLQGVLHALADPVRLEIVRRLVRAPCGANCSAITPPGLAKSSQSFHFQVLREAGLIRSERRGAEVVNSPRCAEVEGRFPGLIQAILGAADKDPPPTDGLDGQGGG